MMQMRLFGLDFRQVRRFWETSAVGDEYCNELQRCERGWNAEFWCCLRLISLIALEARVMQTLPTWLLLVVVNAQSSLTVNFSISRSKQEGALNARWCTHFHRWI